MIILAKAVSYGGNAIRYATEKEKAQIIKINHMPQDITPISMWHRMQLHCQLHMASRTSGRPLQNFMVSFVISPSPKECEGWTDADWEDLQREVLQELDRVNILHLPKCKGVKPTHFSDSMSVAALHRDSKSGKLHLHLDCCRVDLQGNTNDLHQIHIRAMKAAEAINRRHGWLQPEEIREDRREQMSADCMEVLQAMKRWNLEDYFVRLRDKGYKVTIRKDSEGITRGYSIAMGATIIKASELGTGRKLMASRLEDTWQKLHKDDEIKQSKPSVKPKAEPTASPQISKYPKNQISNGCDLVMINAGDKQYQCEIPSSVKDIFANEATLPEDYLWSTAADVMHTAILLFCGYIDGATTITESCGGGGSAPDNNWGKDPDEDERAWARRCIAQAQRMHTRKKGLSR